MLAKRGNSRKKLWNTKLTQTNTEVDTGDCIADINTYFKTIKKKKMKTMTTTTTNIEVDTRH